nr:unnamed protein product [Callosobruchus chinensis]
MFLKREFEESVSFLECSRKYIETILGDLNEMLILLAEQRRWSQRVSQADQTLFQRTSFRSIISNRPISAVELERRRLATASSLSKDLEAITAWGLKKMVEFNASKTQYCTLSNKRRPSEHSVLMNNQALPRSLSSKLLEVSITENMIWHGHVSSIATAAGKKLGYLFRARKYFSPSNLFTLYKAQIRASLEYCSHIWEAAASTTLSILDAVQRRAIRFIGDPALTCHLQPLSHWRAVGV